MESHENAQSRASNGKLFLGVFRIRLEDVWSGCKSEMMVGFVTNSITLLNGEDNVIKFAPQSELEMAA